MITLGTGVGGAVMVDGHLLKGYLGRAGHLGHLSLDVDGPQTSAARREAWSGPSAMPSLSDRRDVSFHAGTDSSLRGRHAGSSDLAASIHCLAADSSMINLLDPEAIILGGGTAAGSSLFQPLQEKLNTMEWQVGSHRVRILPAQLGEYRCHGRCLHGHGK